MNVTTKYNLGITGLDDMFKDEKELRESKFPKIHEISIELIDDFPDHPFKVRDDDDMMLSIDVLSVPTDEAIREVENKLLGVETNITNWQRKQNQNNNFSAVIPYDMELQRNKTKEFLADLTTRDQRMMLCLITMAITSESKEQLDLDTESLQAVAKGRHCQMAVLKWQQSDALNTVLPFGVRKIDCCRIPRC